MLEAPLLVEVEAKLAAFLPQNVANAVWAAATLALRPGTRLLDALVARFQGQLTQANSQARLWQRRRARCCPGCGMCDDCRLATDVPCDAGSYLRASYR